MRRNNLSPQAHRAEKDKSNEKRRMRKAEITKNEEARYKKAEGLNEDAVNAAELLLGFSREVRDKRED